MKILLWVDLPILRGKLLAVCRLFSHW